MGDHPELTLDEKVELIREAFQKKEPIIFGYEKAGVVKSRAVIIDRFDYNKAGQPYVNGIDSLSGEDRSFSVANMRTLHAWHSEGPINMSVTNDDGSPLTLQDPPGYIPVIRDGVQIGVTPHRLTPDEFRTLNEGFFNKPGD